jgi:hypothetical protein
LRRFHRATSTPARKVISITHLFNLLSPVSVDAKVGRLGVFSEVCCECVQVVSVDITTHPGSTKVFQQSRMIHSHYDTPLRK